MVDYDARLRVVVGGVVVIRMVVRVICVVSWLRKFDRVSRNVSPTVVEMFAVLVELRDPIIALPRLRNMFLPICCGLTCPRSCPSEATVSRVVNPDTTEPVKVLPRKLLISPVAFLFAPKVIPLAKLLAMTMLMCVLGRLSFLMKLAQLKSLFVVVVVTTLPVRPSLVWFPRLLALIPSNLTCGCVTFRLPWVQDVFTSVHRSRLGVLVPMLVFMLSTMPNLAGPCEGYRTVTVGWPMLGSPCSWTTDSVTSVLAPL